MFIATVTYTISTFINSFISSRTVVVRKAGLFWLLGDSMSGGRFPNIVLKPQERKQKLNKS
jgi:hypothetical protein